MNPIDLDSPFGDIEYPLFILHAETTQRLHAIESLCNRAHALALTLHGGRRFGALMREGAVPS